MTFAEIIVLARSRLLDWGADWPTTSLTLYRQIQTREQELFTQASRANPDYFGVSASGTIDATSLSADLKDMEAAVDVDPAAAVTRVEILDPGTHPTLVAGDEINVVSIHDTDAALAPRMTLRNFRLTSVGQDIAGVASILVFYGYRPEDRTLPMDGTETAELPEVYQDLLILDLAKWVLKNTLTMEPETRVAALGVLSEEEGEMLAIYAAEVADYAGAQVSRFGSVVGTQRL
jgi:hypothetical protein